MNLLLGISFFVTLALGIPIAFVLGITALMAVIALPNVPLHLIPQRLFTGMDSFPIMAVPFFILAGNLMNVSKITDSIIEFSKLLVGRIRGGLGHVNIVASMFFAGISGSAVADTSALGSILIPAMEKERYSTAYSAAVTASSSIIGPIIPPSIPMVVLATIANLSVGGLFLGGILPGVFIGFGLMGVNYVISRRRNYQKIVEPIQWKVFFKTLLATIIPLLMPLIILGGILGGVFTATEAASVAVAYALFVGFFVMRTLSLKDLPNIFFRSMVLTSTILIVFAMANAFSWILATQEIPSKGESIHPLNFEESLRYPSSGECLPPHRWLFLGRAGGHYDHNPHPDAPGDSGRNRSYALCPHSGCQFNDRADYTADGPLSHCGLWRG